MELQYAEIYITAQRIYHTQISEYCKLKNIDWNLFLTG